VPAEQHEAGDESRAEDVKLSHPRLCCGGRMVIIETFQRGASPRGINRRNQDRYIMIEVNSRRHPGAPLLYRCLLTGNDQARPRAAGTAVLSFDLCCGTPVLPVATAETARGPVDCFPERRSTHPGNKRPASKSP
jgi:hypothetical protein